MSSSPTARQRKAAAKNTAKKATSTTTSQIPPPEPFTPAPAIFAPMFDLLDTGKVYIIHLDQFPWQFKRQIFAVPVLLNLTIAALLFWRAWSAGPVYMGMFYYLSSMVHGETVLPLSASWAGFVFLVVKRVLAMLIDSILIRVILPWPITFFFEGPANPCLWRWNVGFHDTEVVVRVSRGWGTEDLIGPGKAKRGAESPFWKTRVLPGVTNELLKEKTGYALMGKDWDLEFSLMIDVTRMVGDGRFGWSDFKPMVLAWEEGNGWVAWKVGGEEKEATKAAQSIGMSGVEEKEAMEMMEKFKDRLIAMDKEDLFYRSVELMQYESSLGPSLTPERQAAAMSRVRQLFEQHGVDYNEFVASIVDSEQDSKT